MMIGRIQIKVCYCQRWIGSLFNLCMLKTTIHIYSTSLINSEIQFWTYFTIIETVEVDFSKIKPVHLICKDMDDESKQFYFKQVAKTIKIQVRFDISGSVQLLNPLFESDLWHIFIDTPKFIFGYKSCTIQSDYDQDFSKPILTLNINREQLNYKTDLDPTSKPLFQSEECILQQSIIKQCI